MDSSGIISCCGVSCGRGLFYFPFFILSKHNVRLSLSLLRNAANRWPCSHPQLRTRLILTSTPPQKILCSPFWTLLLPEHNLRPLKGNHARPPYHISRRLSIWHVAFPFLQNLRDDQFENQRGIETAGTVTCISTFSHTPFAADATQGYVISHELLTMRFYRGPRWASVCSLP